MPFRLEIDRDPPPAVLERLAETLRRGEVAILPTDTIYGLHALATDPAAVRRIFEAKRRPPDQPLSVLCGTLDQVRALGVEPGEGLLERLDRIWPAPLTAILPLRAPIAATAGRRTIGVRIPALAWLRDLVRLAGPLASTSVNLSGERAVYSTTEIPVELLDRVALLVDSGPLVANASTLVDFTGAQPAVLRQGEFLFTQNLWKSLWKSL